MRKNRLGLLFILLLAQLAGRSQDRAVIQSYIDTYKDIAIAEEIRTGVPASIKLAQGIHETTAGTSELVTKSNNHFGIKCKSDWTGESVSHTDDAPNECFRKYTEPGESYRDHSDFLKKSTRYAGLFKLDPLDYKGWAYGLKRAGYATNPRYPLIIIKLVEDYNLQDYTLIALGKLPQQSQDIATIHDQDADSMSIDADMKSAAAIESHYPTGQFKINETKVIFASAGTSFLSIAQEYEIPLARLFEYNDLEESEALVADRLIYLQRKRKVGLERYHIVKSGQTLREIACIQAIRMESLLEFNHLKIYMLPATGERLYLRSKAPTMPRLAKEQNARIGSR